MKTTAKLLTLLFAAFFMQPEAAHAQVKIPQASTAQTFTQDFALGKITVTYSRPNMKGRKIFGALEPYDKVWRTGANSATVLKFTDDVTIEGKTIPAGEYGLFTIPNPKEWTVILNKTAKQWGAYTYNAADDVARFVVKPQAVKPAVETFTIQLADVKPTSARLQLSWENTLVELSLTADIDARIMESIDAAMKSDRKPYFQAAQYYFENGKDLNTALSWMDEAEKASPKAPHVRLWKGRIQLKMGDKAGAQATAQAGLDLAKEQKNEEYIRLNAQLLAEAKK